MNALLFVTYLTVFSNLRFKPGQDPIIGSLPMCTTAQFTGTAPSYKTGDVVDIQLTGVNDTKIEVSGLVNVTAAGTLPSPSEPDTRFINSRGGEYFFVPSISTLKSWAGVVVATKSKL